MRILNWASITLFVSGLIGIAITKALIKRDNEKLEYWKNKALKLEEQILKLDKHNSSITN